MSDDVSPKAASRATQNANRAAASRFDFSDASDFDRVQRGLLAQLDPPVVRGGLGGSIWDIDSFGFATGDAPPSVHPSLWRQAQLNNVHGLFEVVPGIYQVRGYDISNISFIRSDSGWIVIDPLTVAETAAAARGLVDDHFGPLPIVAVIYTHSHSEMNFYFPTYRALCMAENCVATLHNVYTPRGAEIRDALGWSTYIDDAIDLFLDRSDVAFASHHWPRWGREDMLAFLGGQRDLYRYLHDETMRLANQGHVATEIAEMLELPSSLADEWFNRDYYGTVNHNVKAVYQRYLGWFDANPAHLHELPPVEAATRLVDYMGGADAVLDRARQDFDRGEYRWVAQVVNNVVFADPGNQAARALQADTLEQLGYQAESGPWRSFYLTGAQELRNGTPSMPGLRGAVNVDVMAAMTTSMVLDNCAMKLNGPRAAPHRLEFDVELTDRGERRRVVIANGTLRHRPVIDPAATKIRVTVPTLIRLTSELATVDACVDDGTLEVEGPLEPITTFVSLLDQFDLFFPIIEP